MSTEIKFTDAATTVEGVAFGAAQTAAEVASDPIGSARKQARGFEKKGAPTAPGALSQPGPRTEPASQAGRSPKAPHGPSPRRLTRLPNKRAPAPGALFL